ncbi:DsbA family protein [soil metagenome]
MTGTTKISMVYVFDAYCGWCYGFGPQLTQFLGSIEDGYDLEVISGGLFTGDRVLPASAIPYLDQANQRIAEATGAVFGHSYRMLMADSGFVMDSTAAARGFAALRAQDPERALTMATAMQDAFYRDGRSLSDPATYGYLAGRLGLDVDAVVGAFVSIEAAEAGIGDFAIARTLGVVEFPTLLVRLSGNRVGRLGNATSSASDLAEQMAVYRPESAERSPLAQ